MQIRTNGQKLPEPAALQAPVPHARGAVQGHGQPASLGILHALSQGEKCVSDLAAELGISVHNVSQHLRVLKEQRLVASRKDGQTVYYHVTNMKFIEACRLMRQALIEQHLSPG